MISIYPLNHLVEQFQFMILNDTASGLTWKARKLLTS